MNKNLKVLDVYNNTNSKKINNFNDSINSKYMIQSNFEKIEVDFEWLDIMEDTIKYIDNILRNPNRYIINEEEIVKVEQAKKITVESIKHLAKNTNYIQKIEDNGDVKPSKVLNINKDESFNSYENRLIFTLIQNMKTFIEIKKRDLITNSSLKDEKKCEYNATTRVGAESISMSLVFNSRVNTKIKSGEKDGVIVLDRISNLESRINELSNSPVCLSLVKAHVSKIVPPIKKTNLILKNVNFQYAMRLWDYMQSHFDSSNSSIKKKKVIQDDLDMKDMLDDVFLLNYLAVDTIEENDFSNKYSEETIEKLTESMITKIVEINSDLPIEKLTEIIGDKIAVIKKSKEASLNEIKNKFNNKIISYTNKIIAFDFK